MDLPYLHTLMAAAPRPEHAAHYGRLVLEADIHRTIGQHAVRLVQAARSGQQREDLDVTFQVAATYRTVFEDLARRWGLDTLDLDAGTPADAEQDEADRPQRTHLEVRRTEQPAGRNKDVVQDQVAQHRSTAEVETRLIPAILAEPEQLDELANWLDGQDFARAELGMVFAATLAVHARGEPIDPVTVVFELHRRDAWSDQFTPDDAIGLLNAVPVGQATYLARDVLEGSIRRRAEQAATTIHLLARQPRLTPDRLLPAAAQLDQVHADQQRWQKSEQHHDQVRYTPDPPQAAPLAVPSARQDLGKTGEAWQAGPE
jgi:replicative DNA helicase